MDAAAWDAYYAGSEHPFCVATAGALTSRIDRLAPGRAIDLGCGLGRHARYLAEADWSVQAVDFSSAAIEIAESADGPNIRYIVGDVTRWRPTTSVDLVVVSFLQLPTEILASLLTEAMTWLAPSGHLIYVGRARGDGLHDIGESHSPLIADLARACDGMYIDEIAHLVSRV